MHVYMDNNWETEKNQQYSSWDEHKIMQNNHFMFAIPLTTLWINEYIK